VSRPRERTDRRIEAHELKAGDMLHLTFTGGDDYVEVLSAKEFEEGGVPYVEWTGSSVGGDLRDDIPWGQKVWVKK